MIVNVFYVYIIFLGKKYLIVIEKKFYKIALKESKQLYFEFFM